MLKSGTQVVIRSRGEWDQGVWMIVYAGIVWPRAMPFPGDGWNVHDAGDGLFLLESLTVEDDKIPRYLWGEPTGRMVELRPLDPNSRDGFLWRVHPSSANTIRIECATKTEEVRWLCTVNNWVKMSKSPEGRSVANEFVAFPLSEREKIEQAEEAGDFSHMIEYGMEADGWLSDVPRPVEQVVEPLTPDTPRLRSGDNEVALELIAALQPSFDDGRAGPENSDYEEDDPRRIDWPHNIVSLNTVATGTGIVHLYQAETKHSPKAGELDHCRQLAQAVAAKLQGILPYDGDSPTPFLPFYLVAGSRERAKTMSDQLIRKAFRDTLFPKVPIELHPLDQTFLNEDRAGWASFVDWAGTQTELSQLTYVSIGYDTGQEPNYAAVFPRLVLGLTHAGSLVGACGSVVQA